jgi:hypothetical protein
MSRLERMERMGADVRMSRVTRKLALLGLVLLAAGCVDGSGERAAEPADTAGAADSLAGPTTPAQPPAAGGEEDASAVAQRWTARLPAELRVRRGACPFECCTYRQWTAREPIPVVAEERGVGAPIFTIPAGTAFRADSGNVHLTGIALVAVADSVRDADYWAFGPGDTLIVLDYIGEGHYNVWHDGEVQDVAGFWGAERMPLVASLIGNYEAQWWVHVTMPDGRTGWFRNDPPRPVDGADACA